MNDVFNRIGIWFLKEATKKLFEYIYNELLILDICNWDIVKNKTISP